MPTYEYSCDNCGNEFEREQRITEAPIKKCPKCGKMKARRMIGGGNFILKGGGWESDLYSGPSNRTASAAKKSDDSSSSSSSSGSSSSSSSSSTKSDSKSSTPKSDSKSSAPKSDSKSNSDS
ncbi:MAG: zinc ribbon domain-containing protein [Myxococcales bacterium]|nr:MAG: zinc ribbon domain-containing protein [Myxococcales bacterium]